MLSLVVPIRFINLLGYAAGLAEVGERTGAPDPCDKDNEESGPRLDLGLSCCDVGRSDRRRIQELCEEIESRAASVVFAAATSPVRMYD